MKVLLSGVDVVYCALQRLRRSAFLQHIRLSVLCSSAQLLHTIAVHLVENVLCSACVVQCSQHT